MSAFVDKVMLTLRDPANLQDLVAPSGSPVTAVAHTPDHLAWTVRARGLGLTHLGR